MRLVIYNLVLLLAFSTGCLAADLLGDLRAEVEAIVASATLSSTVQHKGEGGPAYVRYSVRMAGDRAAYELQYKSFLPPNAGLNRAKLNDWSSGLGMVQPSVHGWYSNGFVVATLSDATASASISDSCGEVELVVESGKIVAADFVWELTTGRVRLRFFVCADRPELFLLVTAEPNAEDARLAVDFRCYPGGFMGPFDRRVHTAARELANAGPEIVEVEIDPAEELWMLLADHYAGVTPRPMGPCSVAADPEGIALARAQIKGNYGVIPHYSLEPGRTRALFAVREFPPIPWQEALDEVTATTQEALEAGREALRSLP